MIRYCQAVYTGRRQRALWLTVTAISIIVPLMIWMDSNVRTGDFPVFNVVWESDGKYRSIKTNESIDTTTLIELVKVEDQASKLPSYPIYSHDVDVPFYWCRQAKKIDNESSFDCDPLFAGDKSAIDKAKSWTPACSYNDKEMSDIMCDCDLLKSLLHFETRAMSEDELNYPLAFILVVEKNAEQVARLLASIYQPQNIYCLTYDEHSSVDFKKSMRCLSSCFKNIIMPINHVEIFWADISIMDATMGCMKKFVSDHQNHQWKYVQILSWNDLPLKTNAEMVQIYKILNGSCDSELSFGQPDRFRKYHHHGGIDGKKVGQTRPVPPDGLTMYKGSFAVSLSRDFCNFLIRDPAAQRLYNWSQPVWAPEEQYWSTLIHNTHMNHNSSFPGTCIHYYQMENKQKEWISRFQVWDSRCQGQMVSGSCCFGVGDLPMLKNNPA